MKQAIIVGGGISGLATAYLLREKAKEVGVELAITLLEKEHRVGGKIWSRREDGFLCEWGPNGFLDNKPQTLELCRMLGADSKLLRSNDNARKRFIYSEGVLHQLPENGPAFFKSKLISWPGKLRLMMEPFAGKPPMDEDETLAAFGRRRKMLRNNLREWLDEAGLEALGIKPTARAEELPVDAYVRLANALAK